MLGEALFQIGSGPGVMPLGQMAIQYVDEWHRRNLSQPNASEGRRGDLYPSELRAHRFSNYHALGSAVSEESF